ncbi:MAG: non-homologous end-joining DNA ligase [Chitinivibrionales bacterium]|nr:non-homologous end-joining DNA ligase [Chitinivibrionales bacterium]
MSKYTLKINNRELAVSNLEKELYPAYGFTKGRLLEYYGAIAPYILPHLKGRAITLKRYPNGANREYFFEKRCPPHLDWVETADVPYGKKKQLTACMVNNLETLIWVENLASLELHVPLARAHAPETADAVVFDLDPGENADVLDCAKTAIILREMFLKLKLYSCVKTSGKKGLHVFVPLNSNRYGFKETKQFSRAVAQIVHKNHPDLVTTKMAKESRIGKVFINWSQNDASKTMVSAYSLRAGEKPFVSCPLTFQELESRALENKPERLQFKHDETVLRVKKLGDLFKEMLDKKQSLPYL